MKTENDGREKNETPEDLPGAEAEKLNVVQNTHPFTRYKVIELILCAAAVILGLIYLYTNPRRISLSVLLPAYAGILCAIVPLRWMDMRSSGMKSSAAVMGVILWGVLALAVVVVTVVYFLNGGAANV